MLVSRCDSAYPAAMATVPAPLSETERRSVVIVTALDLETRAVLRHLGEWSDDVVEQYRDRVFEALLAAMASEPAQAAPNLQFVLASRHLERIADHATNIAEDILFWIRGLEVRHGRAKQVGQLTEAAAAGTHA